MTQLFYKTLSFSKINDVILSSNRKDFDFGILIHGGSSSKKIKKLSEITRSLRTCVYCGFDLLKRSNKAVDSVEAAVASMEDSGTFNAGIGSCLTIDKTVEMDASIMDGRNITAGSVGMVQNVKNPIKLARLVMERTDHIMVVAGGATKLANLFNGHFGWYYRDNNKIDDKLLNKYNKLISHFGEKWTKNSKLVLPHTQLQKNHEHYSTVGAVAIDKDGNVASAVSTGGRWLKMHGRIGDSATIGSGFYADNELGAACATGNGEYIMRLCLCKFACDQMKSNNAQLE